MAVKLIVYLGKLVGYEDALPQIIDIKEPTQETIKEKILEKGGFDLSKKR